MEIAITAIGTATPRFKRRQEDIVEFLAHRLALSPAEKRMTGAIYRASGIDHRYSVLGDGVAVDEPETFFPKVQGEALPSTAKRMQIYQREALPLAKAACQDCFSAQQAIVPADITHLITVSCTGMYAPGIDIELVQALGLRSTTKRTCINFMGCYGAFNALKAAESFCRADPSAKVLVVCVELCSLHYQHRMVKDNIVANAIFADGAAAVLVSANPDVARYLSFKQFHCDLLPKSDGAMAWHIADEGFDIVLSAYVPDAIESGIAVFIEKMLAQLSLQRDDIDFFALHPGGVKILEACERALSLEKHHNRHAYDVLREFGNMSSATILFVLKALFHELTPHDHHKHIFSAAFGPGLTLESMLLTTHCSV